MFWVWIPACQMGLRTTAMAYFQRGRVEKSICHDSGLRHDRANHAFGPREGFAFADDKVFDRLDNAFTLYILKNAIGQDDIANGAAFIAAEEPRIATFITVNIVHKNIPNDRIKLAGVAFLIIEIDQQCSLADLLHSNISHKDILHDAAADRIGLDPQAAIEIGAVHQTVFSKDIAGAAGNFAADNHAAMAVFHGAVADNDIFRGDIDTASVSVTAGLDGDAVVAGIEIAVLNEHIPTEIPIAAVVVGAVADNGNAANQIFWLRTG